MSSFARQSGLPTVIAPPRTDLRAATATANGHSGLQVGKTNIVFGKPENRIPLNYVENLIDAMQMAATGGRVCGNTIFG